jgi:glycine cleavage system H protein
METPDDLRYTADHEWVRVERTEGNAARVRIGITDYAQDALGDVVFVQMPTVGSGATVGATVSEVESTKSVSDIYAPLTGTVCAVNEALGDRPELLNSDPYGDGWIFEMDIEDTAMIDSLLDMAAYRLLTEA